MVPREIENNAYVKFWKTNKEYYGIFKSGLLEDISQTHSRQSRVLLKIVQMHSNQSRVLLEIAQMHSN